MMVTSTRPFRRGLALAMVPALLLIGSCSKPSPLCEDAQNLKDSLVGLTQVDFASGGVDALTSAVNEVKSSVDALGTEAKDTFGTEITAVQTQLTALSGAVDQLNGGSALTDVAPAVASSLTALKTALTDIQSTAQAQDCNLAVALPNLDLSFCEWAKPRRFHPWRLPKDAPGQVEGRRGDRWVEATGEFKELEAIEGV